MENFPIKKTVIYPGKGGPPDYADGTKIAFHYKTVRCNDDKTILDDSKPSGRQPMELILGKKFKLEAWEYCIKSMQLHEVASFWVSEELTAPYPVIAKTLRNVASGKAVENSSHCCGALSASSWAGYDDLGELMQKPEPLEFIFEVIKVEEPGRYEKESWAMDEEEKLGSVPKLKEEGNKLYKEKNYSAAAEKYSKGIGHLESLMLREKPGSEEYICLEQQKTPLLLNFGQCQLLLGNYYEVIEHMTTVLEKEPDNVKALFRRAKAHAACWNPEEAWSDFTSAAKLDASLQNIIQKELRLLESAKKSQDKADREKLQGKLFS